jgi:hypothetical protein
VFTPANVLRSSGPCSRSWFTASSSSGAARDAARSSPGTSSARRCGRVLPWAGAAAAPSPAPSHGALTDGVERENPNGVGCGGQLALSLPPLAFEPRRRKGRAKSLRCPGLDCPGARGGAAFSLCAGEVTGARRGGKKRIFLPWPGLDSRAGAAGPSACGSPSWRDHPIARFPPCAVWLC